MVIKQHSGTFVFNFFRILIVKFICALLIVQLQYYFDCVVFEMGIWLPWNTTKLDFYLLAAIYFLCFSSGNSLQLFGINQGNFDIVFNFN